MKQHEVKTGESYLFINTDVEHRKNMIGTIVTVVGRKQGKKKHITTHGFSSIGKSPIRFKLSNGQYANAANLRLQS